MFLIWCKFIGHLLRDHDPLELRTTALNRSPAPHRNAKNAFVVTIRITSSGGDA